MSEIIRQQSPLADSGHTGIYKPDELNADLASATLVKDLVNKLPTPAIDTRKFTIIHGLMKSLNHSESNPTYIDTSNLIRLMDAVSEKSVNVDGKYFETLFAYLMKPKYIIQGMPQGTASEEKKPGIIQRILGIGKKDNQQGQQQ
jgi:hypothetical protein